MPTPTITASASTSVPSYITTLFTFPFSPFTSFTLSFILNFTPLDSANSFKLLPTCTPKTLSKGALYKSTTVIDSHFKSLVILDAASIPIKPPPTITTFLSADSS